MGEYQASDGEYQACMGSTDQHHTGVGNRGSKSSMPARAELRNQRGKMPQNNVEVAVPHTTSHIPHPTLATSHVSPPHIPPPHHLPPTYHLPPPRHLPERRRRESPYFLPLISTFDSFRSNKSGDSLQLTVPCSKLMSQKDVEGLNTFVLGIGPTPECIGNEPPSFWSWLRGMGRHG